MDAQTQALIDRLDAAGLWAKLAREFYAEGTYTPTYQGGTTPGTTTYTSQVGSYVRLGSAVLFQARVEWTNATGTGEARISLPFAVANVTSQAFSASLNPSGVTYSQDFIVAQISPGTQYVAFRSPDSNAASTVVNVEAAGAVVVSGFYWTE